MTAPATPVTPSAPAPTSAPASAPSTPSAAPSPPSTPSTPPAPDLSGFEMDAGPDIFSEQGKSDKPPKELEALFSGTEPETPADPTTAPPADPVTPAVEPEPEPIPFRYKADGEEKLFDGIHEIPGQGALVDDAALPKLRDTLQRHDHLSRQVQQMAPELQRFQQAGGWEKFGKMAEQEAVLNAVGTRFLKLLTDDTPNAEGFPAQLAELATNPAARSLLLREIDILTRGAAMDARTAFGQAQTTPLAPTPDTITASVRQQFTAIASALEQQGMPITPEDIEEGMAAYGGLAKTFVRKATPDEARQLQIPVGSDIVDVSSTHPWFQKRAEFRARERAAKTSAAAATTENATRLARTTPTRPATKAPTAPPGTGTKPRSPAPASSNWKRNMLHGRAPFPDTNAANP